MYAAFQADPKAWAEQLRAAGRVEEIKARLEEIDGLLKPTGFEDIESELDVWTELDELGEAGKWIMHGKRLFSMTTSQFKNAFEDLLDGKGEDAVTATKFIFNAYGQARRAESWDQSPEYVPGQDSRPEKIRPFRGWTDDCLRAFPRWLRAGVQTVVLFERMNVGDDAFRGAGYNAAEKTMLISTGTDTHCVTHELGHVVDYDPLNLDTLDSSARASFIKAVLEEEPTYSPYATTIYAEGDAEKGLKEDWAEAWSYFLTTPEYLKSLAPKRYAAVEEITKTRGLDVETLRQATIKAEKDRIGDPEKARSVFGAYGWNWMSLRHLLPGVVYADARCALPGWRQNQVSRKETSGRGREKLVTAERDDHGRLQSVESGRVRIFSDPTYDGHGRLASYLVENRRYEVRYDGADETPREVWYAIDDRGTLAKMAEFRQEDGKVVQVISMSDNRTWEFTHEYDEAGSLMETTVVYNGQEICRQAREKDEPGRISFFANIDLDDQVPTPDDETTIEYED